MATRQSRVRDDHDDGSNNNDTLCNARLAPHPSHACTHITATPLTPTAGDALDAVELLLPDAISVFAFDFSGSGHRRVACCMRKHRRTSYVTRHMSHVTATATPYRWATTRNSTLNAL